jgi:N-acetylglutamate synthase-like GNAT family acetyltransferase
MSSTPLIGTAALHRASEAALSAVIRSLAVEPQAARVELSAATLTAAKKRCTRRINSFTTMPYDRV